jgi:hypothetical protein
MACCMLTLQKEGSAEDPRKFSSRLMWHAAPVEHGVP